MKYQKKDKDIIEAEIFDPATTDPTKFIKVDNGYYEVRIVGCAVWIKPGEYLMGSTGYGWSRHLPKKEFEDLYEPITAAILCTFCQETALEGSKFCYYHLEHRSPCAVRDCDIVHAQNRKFCEVHQLEYLQSELAPMDYLQKKAQEGV